MDFICPKCSNTELLEIAESVAIRTVSDVNFDRDGSIEVSHSDVYYEDVEDEVDTSYFMCSKCNTEFDKSQLKHILTNNG